MSTTAKRPFFVKIAVASSVCLLCCGFSVAQAQKSDPTLKLIANAWAKHQAAVKTIKLVWRQEGTYVGLRAQLAAVSVAKGGEAKPLEKKSPTTYETVFTLFLDGDSYSMATDVYDPRGLALNTGVAGIFTHEKSILKGGEYQHYSAATREGRRGFVQLGLADRFRDTERSDVRPVMFTLRPLSPKLGSIDLTTYHVAEGRPSVNGVSCLLLEPTNVEGVRTSYWVDPAREYLILHSIRARNDRFSVTTDVEYDQHPALGWIPKRWDVVTASQNRPDFGSTIHAHVLKAIVNEPIAPAEFTLGNLPVGTDVRDNRSGRLIESRVLEPDR
jgi:hypothetical protein